MTTIKNGYLTSEFHIVAAQALASFAVAVKLLQDLSTQNAFLNLHPTVAAFVGAGLAVANALTMVSYIKGRSNLKAAASVNDALVLPSNG